MGKYFPLLTGTSTFPCSFGKVSLLYTIFFDSFMKRFLFGVSLSGLFRWYRERQLFVLCLPYLWQKCINARQKQGLVPAPVLAKSHTTWYKTPCSSLGLGKFSLGIFLSSYTPHLLPFCRAGFNIFTSLAQTSTEKQLSSIPRSHSYSGNKGLEHILFF